MSSSSWKYVIENLENQYGTGASIDEKDTQEILKYLTSYSADVTATKKVARLCNPFNQVSSIDPLHKFLISKESITKILRTS